MTMTAYRVLARKYRPRTFSDLMGQDALVRTLTNAFESGRIAQAFILSGVRGVGKTTTARIIARGLNCVGPDGQGGPTITPCGVCDNCLRIAEDRHVDVLEMDAASRTGIGDIREIIEAVRYAPASARYKVYIIDEVHMLSTQAFNGLLKTLEEPPPHVKFIFATTEIHKVPVTVLSRCQRFDLKRIDIETLSGLFSRVAKAEEVEVEPEAISLIARAAEGSARDGLSLLDQAIAHGQSKVTADAVRAMLSLADRAYVYDLFEEIMRGDVPAALGNLRRQYDSGADPALLIQGLLELTHGLTRLKITPGYADEAALTETERRRGLEIAQALGMAHLARAWTALLKGLGEVKAAANPMMAAEMVVIRLAYMSDLPSPADILAQLKSGGTVAAGGGTVAPKPGGGPSLMAVTGGASAALKPAQEITAPQLQPQPQAHAQTEATAALAIHDLASLMRVLEAERAIGLAGQLAHFVHPVRIEDGRFELRLAEGAPKALPGQIGDFLSRVTGRRWMISLSQEEGQPTWSQRQAANKARDLANALDDPLVKAAMALWPGAKIESVRVRQDLSTAPDAPEQDE